MKFLPSCQADVSGRVTSETLLVCSQVGTHFPGSHLHLRAHVPTRREEGAGEPDAFSVHRKRGAVGMFCLRLCVQYRSRFLGLPWQSPPIWGLNTHLLYSLEAGRRRPRCRQGWAPSEAPREDLPASSGSGVAGSPRHASACGRTA